MIHIIAHLVFAFGILKWLTWEFDRPFTPRKHISWLVAGAMLGVIAVSLAYIDGGRIGNILLHAIGGGMATACGYEYFKSQLRWHWNWRFDIAGLLLLVSTYGVLNELFEFAAELAGFGIFSLDSQDTWRDFVANTSGAVVVWLIVRYVRSVRVKS